jgi:hypothetical protein
MCPTLTCLALAFVGGGVDLGYRPMPDGTTLELIVQIDPIMFRTIGPGDSINAVVTREVQQYIQQFHASQITVAVENVPPPHILPARVPARGASAAPATAPIGPASPLPKSPVVPANATSPVTSDGGPALRPSGDPGPERVGPPAGPPVVPRTANEQSQGAGDPRASSSLATGNQGGNASFQGLPPVDGANTASGGIDRVRLLLYLAIIALAASNGYVGWLFYDARQRYIGLLSMKFAGAK